MSFSPGRPLKTLGQYKPLITLLLRAAITIWQGPAEDMGIPVTLLLLIMCHYSEQLIGGRVHFTNFFLGT